MIFCLSHAFLDKAKWKIFHVFTIQVGLKQNNIFIWQYTVKFASFKTAGPYLVPIIRFHMVCRSRLWTTSKLSFQVSEKSFCLVLLVEGNTFNLATLNSKLGEQTSSFDHHVQGVVLTVLALSKLEGDKWCLIAGWKENIKGKRLLYQTYHVKPSKSIVWSQKISLTPPTQGWLPV